MPPRADVVLGNEEREVLERWARRPKSARALALRCRIVLAAAEGESSKAIAARWGATSRLWAAGVDGSPGVALMACTTSRARANHARSAMRTSSA